VLPAAAAAAAPAAAAAAAPSRPTDQALQCPDTGGALGRVRLRVVARAVGLNHGLPESIVDLGVKFTGGKFTVRIRVRAREDAAAQRKPR
jgi:hypothetical protein